LDEEAAAATVRRGKVEVAKEEEEEVVVVVVDKCSRDPISLPNSPAKMARGERRCQGA